MKLNSTDSKTLSLFWRYTMRYKRDFIFGAGGAVIAVIIQNMIPPLIVASIFRSLQSNYTHHHHLHLSMFVPSLVLYGVLMLIGMALWRLQSYSVWSFEIKGRRDIANALYDHLQDQDERFHADHFGGSLVSQSNKFVNSYERLMDDFIWNILPSIVTVATSVIILAFIFYPYAVALLLVVFAYLLIMFKRITKQLQHNAKVARLESAQTGALADAITNMSAIRSFAREKYESKRFRKASDTLYKANNKLSVEVLKTEAMSHFQTNGFQIIALFAGLLAVTSLNLNASLLYLTLTYTQSITTQLWQFSRLIRNLNRSLGDASEMTEILHIEPSIQDSTQPERSRIRHGEIVFKDVDFTYPDTYNPLFQNFNLKIKPGEKVGLVGSSGGGKTTVTRLLLRFIDIQKGIISIDGQNIANIKQRDLRSKIAYVPQEPMLFHRSLSENIAYGDQEVDHRAIEAVAKMAHAHDFIEGLSNGYDTLVGERGVKLSGGQRQRIAIARAMLKNAPILVLDEATSALDSESELLIQDALWKLMEGRTAIVIAHRLSTIQKMDRIIVLDEGHIAEEGSHKELLARGGIYAKLWGHQSGGFIEDED
jgi:ATP-binding cassette subfamily B protein